MDGVLRAMAPEPLETAHFALGGPTRIALEFGEVRESADLDFVGSDARGYAKLRTTVRAHGCTALFRDTSGLDFPREARTDQYGIRFPVRVDAWTIKVELIHEGRVALGPAVHEPFCPVPCLAIRDCFVEKLLANSDRWPDPAQLARDLVDLAVLRKRVGPIPDDAWTIAERAYGTSIRTDLENAVQRFRADARGRKHALAALRVDDVPSVMEGVETLAADLSLPAPPVEEDDDPWG